MKRTVCAVLTVLGLLCVGGLRPGTSQAQPVATYVPIPPVPGNLLRGDVDLTPRILPGTGFDVMSYLPTRGNLLVLDTAVNAIAATVPLPTPSVRGIDIVFTPDASRAVLLTVGSITVFDVTVTPPVVVASFPNTDTPVSDCDPQLVDLGGTVYCLVPYVSSVRCLTIAPAGVVDLYTMPRSSIAVEAADLVPIGTRCVVPNITTVDFWDLATGAAYVTAPIDNLPKREIDMVPLPTLGFVYWPLDGALYRFDPILGVENAPRVPIAGTTVEGCDMGVASNPSYPFYGAIGTTGFLNLFDLVTATLIASTPTPGAVVRNFDPLLTPWNLTGPPDGLVYWPVIGTTYAVDLSAPFAPIVLATPGGLTDGVDLAGSNDLTRGVLPHPGIADVLDLVTATVFGAIPTPGTLRVDVDAIFPTVPAPGPLGSRVAQPYLGGVLVVSGLTGAPTECVLSMLSTLYVLDLGALVVTSAFPIGPLAAGVDPVITQGTLSPYDDDPFTVRDRDQDFLCNREQFMPYNRRPWYLPYWPLRTPWSRIWGLPPTSQFDAWGRSVLTVRFDARRVNVNRLDGGFIQSILLPAPIVGGAVYDRDWRYAKFYLQGNREAIIDLSPINPATRVVTPSLRVVDFANPVQWPPAHDHWNGYQLLLGNDAQRVDIVDATSSPGTFLTVHLPAPAIYPPCMDYKNKLCSILLRNSQRIIFDLHPLASGSMPSTLVVPFSSAASYWRPVANTVYDPMNLASLDLFHDPIVNRYGMLAANSLTGTTLWYGWLPAKPVGRIYCEKKSKLCKVPMVGGQEFIVNLGPLAWNAAPLTRVVALGSAITDDPVWDYNNRWELNVHRPNQITVVDNLAAALVSSFTTPALIIGPPTIDPINKYARVRLAGGMSYFIDLFELARGRPATRIDNYGADLIDDAVFDPSGGFDLAVLADARIVVTRSRTGHVLGSVSLPSVPQRPLSYDPHNRVAQIFLGSGTGSYLLDMSKVDDSGPGLPTLLPLNLDGPPLALIDMTPPAPVDTTGFIVSPQIGADGIVKLTAPAGATQANAYVAIVNQSNASIEPAEVKADASGGFIAYVSASTNDTLCIIAADAATNVNSPVCYVVHSVPTDVQALPPVTSDLAAPSPNPFSSITELRFGLVSRTAVRLEVFDAKGRRVRKLLSGTLGAGHYAQTWDGRDGSGRAVPSGVYFVRLNAGGIERVQRVVRMQ